MTGHLDSDVTEHVIDRIAELDAAAHQHITWLQRVHKTIVCRNPVDPADLEADAHHHCAFGRWYDGVQGEDLVRAKVFAEIGARHRMIHSHARRLLQVYHATGSVPEGEYDQFMTEVADFNGLLRTLQTQMWQMISLKDPLTGLKNRHGLRRESARLFDSRKAAPFDTGAVILVDLDHFKTINDTHGHGAGDEVLREVAAEINAQLRESDLIFRYGGEEFLILLPDQTLAAVGEVCERLRRALADRRFHLPDGSDIPVTASFGAAALDYDAPFEAALERADRALYQAKEAGRNRVVTAEA